MSYDGAWMGAKALISERLPTTCDRNRSVYVLDPAHCAEDTVGTSSFSDHGGGPLRTSPSTRTPAVWAALMLAALLLIPWPASASPSPGEGTQSLLGNDISWPQCGKDLP